MWRNLKFLHMPNVENSEMTLCSYMERNFKFLQNTYFFATYPVFAFVCGENLEKIYMWRKMTDIRYEYPFYHPL